LIKTPVYAILVIAAGALIVSFQIYFPVPLIPQLADHYGVSLSAAGWISGAFGLSYAVGFMIFGPLSDSLGRKRMMVWGMVPLIVATAALWQVTSFEGVIAWRIVQGVAAATFAPTAVVYIADSVPQNLRPTALAAIGGSFLSSALLGRYSVRLSAALETWQTYSASAPRRTWCSASCSSCCRPSRVREDP